MYLCYASIYIIFFSLEAMQKVNEAYDVINESNRMEKSARNFQTGIKQNIDNL